jgi:hypothetical protein
LWPERHWPGFFFDIRFGIYSRIRSSESYTTRNLCHAEVAMRDPEIIETELMEISAIPDDTLKFERIIAWCASHPDEVPFALHQFMGRRAKHPSQPS